MIAIGALVLLIGALGFGKREDGLREFRERGLKGQETGGPSAQIVVAYAFPAIGLIFIAIGILMVV